MLQTNDFRKCEVLVFQNGTQIYKYVGGAYFYYNDLKQDGCIHFVDDKNKHHRFYSAAVVINEL